ncbi:MAG TPA: ABC-2 family transporter protein [Spirochaetia bacterium]|nr:ABC-2 family transporter protein [Spirochaetia bacterium]
MRFATYIKTAALGFCSVANYRTEVWFQVAQRLLILSGIILLWSVIGTAGTGQTYTQLIAYFLVANGVRDLIDAQFGKFGSSMVDDIKAGKISAYLLQPTRTVIFMYFKHLGTRGVTIVFYLIYIVVGIVLAPPTSLIACLLFFVVVATGLVICLAQCTMVGCLAFWITDAKATKNVVNHFTRVLSGSLIPLTFFPVAYQVPVMLSPFASYAYLPATLLQAEKVDSFLFLQVGVSICWAIGLLLISRLIWRKGVRQYEAVGL